MPTFFVASDVIAPPNIRISGSLLRHVKDSLRIHPGEILIVTDDRAVRYRTEVTEVSAHHMTGRILETMTAPSRTSPSLILAQALLKGDKMDWVIQKATELGVDRIVPVYATHSVVKLHADRVVHQRTRWQRIALEAAQQSERWTVPDIATPTDLSKASTTYPSAVKFLLAERSAETSLTAAPLPNRPDQSVMLLIGPEGGWSEDELRLLREQGYKTLTLGSRILRAETAAIAALSILQARLGELG